MKRTINSYLLAAVVGVSALSISSCYKDEGNYDYSFDSLNKIDSVTFVPEAVTSISGKTIEFTQPLESDETKRVEATVSQSLASSTDQLEFSWMRTYEDEEGNEVKDTIHTNGYLDVVLPAGRLIEYTVMLEVRDKTTDLANYTKIIIKTRPLFYNSLFVLHQESGETKLGNIEIVGADTNIRMDAYKTVNPDATDNPFSRSVALGYSTYQETRPVSEKQTLAAFNYDGTGSVYDPFGFTERTDLGRDFVLPSTDKDPSFIADKLIVTGDNSSFNGYKLLISKDGRFRTSNHYLCFIAPGLYASDPLNLSESDYKVSAGVITADRFLLWDRANNRFIYKTKEAGEYQTREAYARRYAYPYMPVLDAMVSFSGLESSGLSPVSKTAVYAYISYRDDYDSSNPFFIFKDADSGYYLYELTELNGGGKDSKSKGVTRGDDGDDKGDSSSSEPAYSIDGKALSGFTPSNDKTICYDPWFSTNYLFYANGGNLYRYNTSNGDNTLVYTAPTGYSITLVKPRSYDSGIYTGDLGRYLSLALQNGSKGAVAEIYLNTAGDVESILPSATTLYEGFGTITDLQFANDYFYELPDYMK